MKVKFSKTEAEKEINEFFSEIKSKTPKEIKKIKRLAMAKKVVLGKNRKLFCKKCLMPYLNPKIRIRDKKKLVICKECGYLARWKL